MQRFEFWTCLAAALLLGACGENTTDKPTNWDAKSDSGECVSDTCVPPAGVVEDLQAKRINGFIRYAEHFPGDNAGQKLQAALEDVLQPDCKGGVIDARGLTGEQTIDVPLTIGGPDWCNPVVLLLGAATFTTSETITVGAFSSIKGNPVGMTPGGGGANGNSRITAIRGTPDLDVIVQLGGGVPKLTGANAVLEDLLIDGGFPPSATRTQDLTKTSLFVNRAGRIDLTRVSVQHGRGYGIRMINSPSSKLTKVMILRNAGPGLSLWSDTANGGNCNDLFVNQSEILSNSIGIELKGASGLRVTNTDFGGNTTGLDAYGGSCLNIITGNQFGGSKGHDISMTGAPGCVGGNVISGNAFITASQRSAETNTYDVIHLQDSANNAITGNMISTGTANAKAWSGIHIFSVKGATLPNAVSGNVIAGVRGAGGAINAPPEVVLAGNLDATAP